MTYKLKAKVWVYPGLSGWHFVNLNKEMSEKIRTKYPKGFVKIEAKIGKTVWKTSLFPHKESKCYLLSIKAQVRKKEDIWKDDEVTVSFTLC